MMMLCNSAIPVYHSGFGISVILVFSDLLVDSRWWLEFCNETLNLIWFLVNCIQSNCIYVVKVNNSFI
jgi:hypothetical protein